MPALLDATAPFVAHYHDLDGECCSIDWSEQLIGEWGMYGKESVRWYFDGQLSTAGRLQLLRHFDLEALAEELPLSKLARMSPDALMELRHTLDGLRGPHTPVNHLDGHVHQQAA